MSDSGKVSDPLQPAIRRLSYANGLTKRLAAFCAARLIFALYADAAMDAWRRRWALTVADAARSGLLLTLPVTTGKVLHRSLGRWRPFVRTGIPPLVHGEPTSAFPSDHTIQAAALVAQANVTHSRCLPWRLVGAAIVVLGRLGTNVHDGLDILGGLGIVTVYTWLIGKLPLPEGWTRTPLLRGIAPQDSDPACAAASA